MTTGRLIFDQPWLTIKQRRSAWLHGLFKDIHARVFIHPAILLLIAGALRCASGRTNSTPVLDHPRDTMDGAMVACIARSKSSASQPDGPWQVPSMSLIHDWRCMHCANIFFFDYVMFMDFDTALYMHTVNKHHLTESRFKNGDPFCTRLTFSKAKSQDVISVSITTPSW